jgi:hypothetical protein
MKYNFKDLVATNIEGTAITSLNKTLGNAIYNTTQDLAMVDVAKDIYNDKTVDLTVSQIEEVKRIVKDEKNGFFAFVQKAILDFLEKGTDKK